MNPCPLDNARSLLWWVVIHRKRARVPAVDGLFGGIALGTIWNWQCSRRLNLGQWSQNERKYRTILVMMAYASRLSFEKRYLLLPTSQVVVDTDRPLQGRTLTLMRAPPSARRLGPSATLNRLCSPLLLSMRRPPFAGFFCSSLLVRSPLGFACWCVWGPHRFFAQLFRWPITFSPPKGRRALPRIF